MVSGNSLKLDLDFTLHGATDAKDLLVVGFEQDFLLDEFFVFIRGDPSWAGSQYWGLIGRVLDGVVFVVEKDLEVLVGFNIGFNFMGDLVKVVVNYLTQVNKHILLNADLSVFVNLDS